MKLGSKYGWSSIMPYHLQIKISCCMFSKVDSASYSPGKTPIYLNVYDLTPINGCFYWAGFGVFHSGVEVNGVEYAFGVHDFPTTGVFEVEPRKCPNFKFRKSIFIGTTHLNPIQVREFIEYQSAKYNGDTYHMIVKNCNHFCEDICYKLTGNQIPKWVNRLARIGSSCNCIFPGPIRHEPNCQRYESEKKRPRSSFSCFSSISTHQRKDEETIPPLLLDSHYKGCLPPWKLKSPRKDSLRDG